MIDLFKNAFWYIIKGVCTVLLYMLKEAYDEVVRTWFLALTSDELKTNNMCEKSVTFNPYTLEFVPDDLKTKRMCKKFVEKNLLRLKFVSDYFKTQNICDKAVKGDLYSLLFVPDWFVTQKQLKIWHDDDEYCDDHELIEWYNGYKKRKAQKAKIKEEFLPIAWNPSRYWHCCMSDDEKQETDKLWMKNNRQKNCGGKNRPFRIW